MTPVEKHFGTITFVTVPAADEYRKSLAAEQAHLRTQPLARAAEDSRTSR
jgi:hypothetical protein